MATGVASLLKVMTVDILIESQCATQVHVQIIVQLQKTLMCFADIMADGSSDGHSEGYAWSPQYVDDDAFQSDKNGVSTNDTDDDLDSMYVEADETHNLDAYWTPLDEAGCTPLFTSSRMFVLAATFILINLCRVHYTGNLFISKLLLILSKSILPEPNSLPNSESKALSMLCKLGLGTTTYTTCPEGCVLFQGEHVDAVACPKCGAYRWKRVGIVNTPASVLRHFPLISRLRQMFAMPVLVCFMTWHKENKPSDGVTRSPVNSPWW